MRNFSHLPDELWLLILDRSIDDTSVARVCETWVLLGNLSMTCRRLRRLVMPMLEESIGGVLEDVAEAYDRRLGTGTRMLIEFWHAVYQCPMLVQYVRTLRTDITAAGKSRVGDFADYEEDFNSRGQLKQLNELRLFRQKVLRALGVSDCIREWDSSEGWLALLLLVLPKLERITWTGNGTVELSSPLRKMVDIAKKQTPPISFRSLGTVAVACRNSTVPDALKWDFLVLPSVEAIIGGGRPGDEGLADRLHVSRDLRHVSITTFQSGRPLPMHLLEEKFRLMPRVRSFRYRYSLHHNGGFLQMMALSQTLRQLHRSLEEINIEPLTPTSAVYRSRARTSPHMWKRLPSEQQQLAGNLGDASWLLGDLVAFERLRIVRAPRTALYDPRYVVALKHLLPRSLQHLDVSPGPAPHKLDAATLTTQLVAVVRSKPERFPHFTKLTVGDHSALLTPLLRDICAKFDVEIEATSSSAPLSPCKAREPLTELAVRKSPAQASARPIEAAGHAIGSTKYQSRLRHGIP